MYDLCSIPLKLPVKTSKRCNECAFETASNLVLLGHLCTRVQHVKCDQCERILSGKLGLQRHKRRQHIAPEQRKWFKCQYCDYKSTDSSTLQRHILRRHLTEEEKNQRWHKCLYCDFRTPLKIDMKRHNRKHSNDEEGKWLRCSFCTFKTFNEQSLKEHIKIRHREGGEKWHQCDYCPFKTLYMYSLVNHKKYKHSNGQEITWFKCSSCDYQVKTKKALKNHIEKKACVHDEGGPWLNCEKCLAKFKSKDSLRIHRVRKHASDGGRALFQCLLCDYKHVYENAVNYHMAYKHIEDPVKCDLCGRMCRNEIALKHHMRLGTHCRRNVNEQVLIK